MKPNFNWPWAFWRAAILVIRFGIPLGTTTCIHTIDTYLLVDFGSAAHHFEGASPYHHKLAWWCMVHLQKNFEPFGTLWDVFSLLVRAFFATVGKQHKHVSTWSKHCQVRVPSKWQPQILFRPPAWKSWNSITRPKQHRGCQGVWTILSLKSWCSIGVYVN